MKIFIIIITLTMMLLGTSCSDSGNGNGNGSGSGGSGSGGSGSGVSLVGIWKNVDDLWDTVDFYKFKENRDGFAFSQCGTEDQRIRTFFWEIQGSRLCFSNFGEAGDDFCFGFDIRNDTLTFDGIYTRTNELPNCQ
jgi:hypothetical protein